MQKKRDILRLVNVEGKRILDVGGGMGRIAIPASKLNSVWLCDISQAMLDLARANCRNPNFYTVKADARHLPFEDGFFDYVIATDLICHLPDPTEGLFSFKRVLKQDGLLIADSTNSNPLWVFFYPRYIGRRPIWWAKTLKRGGILPGWERTVRHYRKSEFESFLEKAGFQPKRWINYGPRLCPKWHLVVASKLANHSLQT